MWLGKILQHTRHVSARHWDPSDATHLNGYFDEGISSYPRQNTRVEMCQFTRIPMTRLNVPLMLQIFFLSKLFYLSQLIGSQWYRQALASRTAVRHIFVENSTNYSNSNWNCNESPLHFGCTEKSRKRASVLQLLRNQISAGIFSVRGKCCAMPRCPLREKCPALRKLVFHFLAN